MAATPEYCLFCIDSWVTCLTASEWAAWVQAIGSVAAIYFAGRIARNQWKLLVKRENARDNAREFQRMTVLIELADYAVGLLAKVPSPANEGVGKVEMLSFLAGYRNWSYSEAAQVLKRFGPEHVPDGRALVHIIEIVRCLSDMGERIDQINSFAHAATQDKTLIWTSDKAITAVDEIQSRAETARKMLRNIRQQYG